MTRDVATVVSTCLLGLLMVAPAFSQSAEIKGSAAPTPPRLGCVVIPDNTYVSPTDGTAGMVCLSVPPGTGSVSGMRVTVNANHTWVGDLTFKVVPPNAAIVATLFNRPGVPGSTFGDSSDLANANPLRFFDSFTDDPETMGNTIPGAGIVCAPAPAGDGRCDYRNNPGTEPPLILNSFNGYPADGDWQVCVGDSGAGDTGSFCSANIEFQAGAPPPAADLVLTQSNNAAGNALLIGNTFEKTLTVTNNGPSTATGITVSDTLPPQLAFVSSNCGAIAAGQVVTYTIATLSEAESTTDGLNPSAICVLTVRVQASGTIFNTASITASTPADPIPANNTTTAQIGPTGGGTTQTAVPALDRNMVLILLGLVTLIGAVAMRQRQS